MDLLFTIPDFWPHVRRGAERLVHDLGVEMIRRGHHVTVVTRTPGPRAARATMDGIDVRYRPAHAAAFARMGLNPMESFALPAAAAGVRARADVLAAHYPSDGLGLYLAAKIRRRPVAINIMGWPDRRWIEFKHPRTHRMMIRALEACPVTVLGEGAARQMRSEFGIDPHVLRCGTFTSAWHRPRPPQERRTIVCSAAVDDERKRVGLLVRAFVDVGRDEPDLDLLLVGPGDASAHLADAHRIDPGVAARISHLPGTQPAELPDILARCTVGALTSVREAFGLVVIEYLASGMPAVGCDDAGVTEILTPDTGALFRPDDVAGCADALRRALELAGDPATVDRARARADEFDWSKAADAHEAFYRRLAAGTDGAR